MAVPGLTTNDLDDDHFRHERTVELKVYRAEPALADARRRLWRVHADRVSCGVLQTQYMRRRFARAHSHTMSGDVTEDQHRCGFLAKILPANRYT